MLTPSQIDVQSVVFGQGGLEVSYVETFETDATTGIQEIRSVAVPAHLIPDQLADLLDSLDQVLREVAVVRRQPPPTRRV
jgi:hypothetical protein